MPAAMDFRGAVEARSLSRIAAVLDPDIEFHSPVLVRPYRGRTQVMTLLGVLLETFEDFAYTDELVGRRGAGTHALIFGARVAGKSIQGLDLLTVNEAGLVADLTVMVRPLPSAMVLARLVGRRMEAMEVSHSSAHPS